MDFIYSAEFEGVKILFWHAAVMQIFFIDFYQGPSRTIGHCTSSHSLNPPVRSVQVAVAVSVCLCVCVSVVVGGGLAVR